MEHDRISRRALRVALAAALVLAGCGADVRPAADAGASGAAVASDGASTGGSTSAGSGGSEANPAPSAGSAANGPATAASSGAASSGAAGTPGASLAAVTVASLGPNPVAAPTPPAKVDVMLHDGAPIAVPASFVGLHLNRWPSGDPTSRPPSFAYGTVRSLNYDPAGPGGVSWYDVNTAPGVYDWARLDQWVATHHANGKQLIYTLYGTPQWASSRPGTLDPYNSPGGDSKPVKLADVAAFVSALVTRYNGDGTRRIRYLETWNEPDVNGLPYWRDSAADLAALARTVYQAAKAADPGITVLGPAWVDFNADRTPINKVWQFMEASDGAGGQGKQWMDAFAWHHYDYGFDIREMVSQVTWLKQLLGKVGREKLPIFLTEVGGWQWNDAWPSAQDKARQIQRWMMVAAATGMQTIGLYMHESLVHLGDPSSHPEIAAAIQEVGSLLAGQSIARAALLEDGRIWVAFANGTTLVR